MKNLIYYTYSFLICNLYKNLNLFNFNNQKKFTYYHYLSTLLIKLIKVEDLLKGKKLNNI